MGRLCMGGNGNGIVMSYSRLSVPGSVSDMMSSRVYERALVVPIVCHSDARFYWCSYWCLLTHTPALLPWTGVFNTIHTLTRSLNLYLQVSVIDVETCFEFPLLMIAPSAGLASSQSSIIISKGEENWKYSFDAVAVLWRRYFIIVVVLVVFFVVSLHRKY